jgi:amino acid permease
MGKNFILATGLLAGTIIGAGVFSLPYVFSRVGWLNGFFYLFVFTAVYGIIHWMYARILQVQDDNRQFFYLARRYFGKLANPASLIILAELIFVLLVYLVLAPTFSMLIFGGDKIIHLAVFWLLGSVFIFARLSWMGFADFIGVLCILGIIAVVFSVSWQGSLTTPAFQKLDFAVLFLPFGPLLFSLAGRPAIHKVIEEYRRSKVSGRPFLLKRAILWGTAIPAVVYSFFIISVLKLNPNVSPEALNSLGFLSPITIVLLGTMGLITLWTSYFMIGVNVKDILRSDLKYPVWLSALVVLLVPPLLYFVGFQEFLFVITFAGSIFLVLEAIFIITLWRRAFPQHRFRWLTLPLALIFITALTYEVVSFFKS